MIEKPGILFFSFTLVMTVGCTTPQAPAWHPLPTSELQTTLTLEHALELAGSSDVRLAQWNARRKAARAQITAAFIPPNPTFSATWEDIGLREPGTGKNLATSAYGISYPFLFWVTRPGEIKAARAQSRSEAAAICDEQRQLAIEIGTSWYEIAANNTSTSFALQMVLESKESLRLANALKAVGSGSGLDVTRAQQELLQAKADLADQQHAQRVAQLTFAFSLGCDRPVFPLIEALSLDNISIVTHSSPIVPEEVLQTALAHAPSFQKAQARQLIAEQNLATERLRRIPWSDVQGEAVRKHEPDGMVHNFSLSAVLPIFNWNQSAIAQAKAELLTAQATAEVARRDVAQRVILAWEQLATSQEKVRNYIEPALDRASRILSGTRALYQRGQVGYDSYLLARRDAIKVRRDAVDGFKDFAVAQWQLKCQLGQVNIIKEASLAHLNH